MTIRDRALRRALGDERAAQARLARALMQRRRHILFISHMRSYSTLLGHLLGSHEQISGYTEQHQSYKSFADLTALTVGVWRVSDFEAPGPYVFDKLLHDRLVVSDEVLHREDVLPIYGIREPVGSIRSIVAAGRHKAKDAWSTPEGAAIHLVKRYAAVRAIADRRPDAAALFTDAIVAAPEATLAGLTEYLGLGSPLSASYATFPKTGKAGFGDPMGPIGAGRIVADRTDHDVEVPEDVVERLQEDYLATCDHLTRTCRVVLGSPAISAPGPTEA